MIYKTQKSRFPLVKILIAAPLLALIFTVIGLSNNTGLNSSAGVIDQQFTKLISKSPVTLDITKPSHSAIKSKDTSSVGKTSDDQTIYKVVEQMPKYPSGENSLFEYISKNIHYPEIAKKAGIYGRALVQFVVSKTGKIINPQIVKGIGSGCDEEVLRVIRNMPDWIPGMNEGKNVDVSITLPITFALGVNFRDSVKYNPSKLELAPAPKK